MAHGLRVDDGDDGWGEADESEGSKEDEEDWGLGGGVRGGG